MVMSKKVKATLIAVAVAAAGFGVYKLAPKWLAKQSGEVEHLTNRVWVTGLPTESNDLVGHLVLLDHDKGQYGVRGQSSQWRRDTRIFQWNADGRDLAVYFPQNRKKGKAKVRTWECEGEAPAPFNLCLEVSSGRRQTVFYSRKAWTINTKRVDRSFNRIVKDEPALAGLGLPDGVEDLQETKPLSVDAMPDQSAF